MTERNIQHQALQVEAVPYMGINGQSCLRTHLTDRWLPFLQDFSIVNGIHMSPFDGHEQNVAMLFTTNSFGGDSYIPQLHNKQTLDFLRVGKGNFLVEISNASNAIQLETRQAISLGQKLLNLPTLGSGQSTLRRSIHLAKEGAKEETPFGRSSALLANSLGQLPRTARVFTMLAENDIQNEEEGTSQLVAAFFKENLTKSAVIVFDTDLNQDLELDVHDSDSALRLPTTIDTIYSSIIRMLTDLKKVPATPTKSIYDCSTIVIASEFGRTMRQRRSEVMKGGTDHNPFRNTILIGGKGIRGGLVLGSTDLKNSEEFLNGAVTDAHRSVDPQLSKVFGLPFDYKTQKSSVLNPQTHKLDDYLNMASVTNTILKLFDRPSSSYRSTERGKPAAPILRSLLR